MRFFVALLNEIYGNQSHFWKFIILENKSLSFWKEREGQTPFTLINLKSVVTICSICSLARSKFASLPTKEIPLHCRLCLGDKTRISCMTEGKHQIPDQWLFQIVRKLHFSNWDQLICHGIIFSLALIFHKFILLVKSSIVTIKLETPNFNLTI